MTGTEFHKGDRTTFAYTAAQAVNLRSDGWVEGAAPPSVAAPEVVPPRPVVVPTPVDPAPTAQEAP